MIGSKKGVEYHRPRGDFGTLTIRALPRNQWNWLRKFSQLKGMTTEDALAFCVRGIQKLVTLSEDGRVRSNDRYLTHEGALVIREIIRRVSGDDSDLDTTSSTETQPEPVTEPDSYEAYMQEQMARTDPMASDKSSISGPQPADDLAKEG